jgi:glycosyltransferase involved in cell wall biosynthesis
VPTAEREEESGQVAAAGRAADPAGGAAYPPPGSVPLSVLVPTRNEREQIAECLATVGWAAEVVVVDSESTDGTGKRAGRLGAKVWTRRFDGYGPQKNWALERLAHPWALCVDADERVSPELAREIQEVIRGGAPAAGYRVRRLNHFFERRVERAGWGGERVLRLFRRDRGRFDERRVHERVVLDGPVGELRGALLHYPYRTWGQCVEKLWRYARAGALEAYAGGRRAGPADLVLRPLGRFARMYLAQRGVLDGGAGAALCGLAAAQVFLKYALLWDLGCRGSRAARALEEESEFPGGRTG